jgi:hypothetical protein
LSQGNHRASHYGHLSSTVLGKHRISLQSSAVARQVAGHVATSVAGGQLPDHFCPCARARGVALGRSTIGDRCASQQCARRPLRQIKAPVPGRISIHACDAVVDAPLQTPTRAFPSLPAWMSQVVNRPVGLVDVAGAVPDARVCLVALHAGAAGTRGAPRSAMPHRGTGAHTRTASE